MKARIDNRTQVEVINSLAQSFPTGRLFKAVHINGSNIRKLLIGLAIEIARIEQKISKDIYQAYFINEEFDGLLEEWESALGIPDDCFSITGKTRDERIEQVIAKLTMWTVVTEQDFIDMAAIFGYTVTIQQGIEVGTFPLILPFILGSPKSLRFTMVINLPTSLAPTSVFPLTLPFTLSSGGSSIVECLFNKLKPANVVIVYNYILP